MKAHTKLTFVMWCQIIDTVSVAPSGNDFRQRQTVPGCKTKGSDDHLVPTPKGAVELVVHPDKKTQE